MDSAITGASLDIRQHSAKRHTEGRPAVEGKPLELMTRDELLSYIRQKEAKRDAVPVREQMPCPAGCDDGVDWSSGRAEVCGECDGAGTFYVADKKRDAMPAEGWQPIETAPLGAHDKPDTYFIGGVQDGKRINTATCYRNKHRAFEWWGGGIRPTHWMPLLPLYNTSHKEG
jgi:hypothetical protein